MKPRFRLRLFVQEFDLRPGTTRIGRSASCAITIDDPSISREHAEITVDDTCARIRDLGSRNGVKLNGIRITKQTALKDGDKVCLGQQDLVFNSDDRDRGLARTARMTCCAKCNVPYAQTIGSCPLCRAQPSAVDETSEIEMIEGDRPTPVQPTERTSWWLLLHAELVDKAVTNGRFAEAEQALQRVDEAFASAILSNAGYDDGVLEPVLAAAVRFAGAQDHVRWLAWVLQTLRAFHITPSNALVAQLETAPPRLLDDARVPLASYVAEMRDSSPSLEGLAAIAADLASCRRLFASPPTTEAPRAS